MWLPGNGSDILLPERRILPESPRPAGAISQDKIRYIKNGIP